MGFSSAKNIHIIARHRFASIPGRSDGLALATILLAVVLLAAIAVTVALSARAGNSSSAVQQDRLEATTLISMMQTMRTGIDRMQTENGFAITDICWCDLAQPGPCSTPCMERRPINSPHSQRLTYPQTMTGITTGVLA